MSALVMTVHQDAPDWVVDDCMQVMNSAFDPHYGEAWTAAQTRSMMSLPGTALIIGRIGDVPAGFALIRSILDEAELMLIAVAPACRNQGYGQSLLYRALDLAISSGCTRCLLEVREGNPALSLYHAAGFEQYNVRRNYYRGRNGEVFDAISYSVFLNQEQNLP